MLQHGIAFLCLGNLDGEGCQIDGSKDSLVSTSAYLTRKPAAESVAQ